MTTDGPPRVDTNDKHSGKDLLGCLLLALLAVVLCCGVTWADTWASELRTTFAPWFAEQACRLSGCGRLAMATIGWAPWAVDVGVLTVLALLYRPHRRLFYALLLPAAVLLTPNRLLANDRNHHDLDELVAGTRNGDAIELGNHWGSLGFLLVFFTVAGATTAMRTCRPRNVWVWQLICLAAPGLMVPALVVALVMA